MSYYRSLIFCLLVLSGILLWTFGSKTPSPLATNPLKPLSFDREQLLHALQGDVQEMERLTALWQEREATLKREIPQEKRPLIQQIPSLSVLVQKSSLEPVEEWGKTSFVDDSGTVPLLPAGSGGLLPQTYLSASILLSLCQPEEIIALPSGMRKHTSLYPTDAMKQIVLDTDRQSSEAIIMKQPRLAFVAYYSNPTTVQALKNQGISTLMLDSINTVDEVLQTIERIGLAAGYPTKGRLLARFTASALKAIDNERLAYGTSISKPVLYLSYHGTFSTPSQKTLTSQLLERLKAPTPIRVNTSETFNYLLTQELLLALNPALLLISSNDIPSTRKAICSLPAVQQIAAARSGNLFFLDEEVQNSPSQYLALAYYDLCQALLSEQ
jgi:iron complex transport system substrate-binding protein